MQLDIDFSPFVKNWMYQTLNLLVLMKPYPSTIYIPTFYNMAVLKNTFLGIVTSP